MNSQACIICGGVFGAIGVAAGALGAHLLKSHLSPQHLESYETAVRYQIIHALALVVVGLLLGASPSVAGQVAAWCFVVGIVLFSGGIYAWLATGTGPIVRIVPVGGFSYIIGWIALIGAGWAFRGP